MIASLMLLTSAAMALDHHVVSAGDTVEQIASGDLDVAAQIRELNAIAPGEEPGVGDVLILPFESETQGAMVLMLIGEATVTIGDGAPTSLDTCMDLPPGASVCTREGSYVTLRLATSEAERRYDDISLLPETCLTVDSTWAGLSERSSLVSVTQGSISVSAAENGQGGRVTVQTPTGVTSGEGGGFRVTLEEDASRTEAVENVVAVFGAGEEVTLEVGQGTRVEAGAAPSAPVQLLGAGTLTHPADQASLRHPVFRWEPTERALGYRIEIATDPSFSRVVQQEEVPGTEWIPDTLFLPYRVPGLWWRVSSFDRTGFLGLPSAPRELTFPQGVGI